jgi:hypothetical protein
VEKFPLYLKHHGDKILDQWFPSLYTEYFALWPPTPNEEEIEAASGNIAAATAQVYKVEERVRTRSLLTRPNDLHANHSDDQRMYRWMTNRRTRSKHGLSGEGSSVSLNLTRGPPKVKAAVQAYVKYYWQSKVKQEVINKWAPTPETDLFDEADIGEEQVAWEALTPMDKNIPLWFRMEIGRKLYEAESDEVKAEIDRLREKEKDDAVAARVSPTMMFVSEAERLQAMKKFDE